jgi:PAS domain S-box-containing protein
MARRASAQRIVLPPLTHSDATARCSFEKPAGAFALASARSRAGPSLSRAVMKILHLEDHPHDAQLVRSVLAATWPEVEITLVNTAADYAAALARGGYDVILADHTLPSFSGLAALQQAREISPHVPFIFVTGTLDEESSIAAVENGATDYVFKPQLQRLVIVVRRAVRESGEQRELRLSIQSLKRSEERYRKIFAYNPLPMWIVDAASHAFLDVNEAAVNHYGYSREEFRTMTLTDVVVSPPTTPPMGTPPITDRERPTTRLRQHHKKDGTVVDVEVFTLDIDFGGKPARLTLVNDVTESRGAAEKIRRLNAELEQRVQERTARLEAAMKELEAFSYSVSHDLRSPLRGIDGFARALTEDYGSVLDAEGKRLIATIRGETRRMGQLIDDLLAFSRAARQQLDTAPVDMTELARSAFQNLIEAAPERNPGLQLNPLPEAIGDRALLRQVFANLLDNAMKFSARHPAPRIELSGWCDAGENIYCVKDNGVGFDPRMAHKLFGVFQRLHRQEDFVGTGVGLALVQRIVHRHGGRTWAESSVGAGAAFYFSLPEQRGLLPAGK